MYSMSIGIFTESFLPQVNGVVTAICNASAVLSKKHDVEIFTVGEGPAEAAGCRVHRFRGASLPTYPGYKFFIPTLDTWRRLSPVRLDVIHIRSSVVFCLVAMRLARCRKVPLVGTFDTPITDYVRYVPVLGKFKPVRWLLSRIAEKYTKWLFDHCDAVIAPSSQAAKWLRKAGYRKEAIILSNGVDPVRFNPAQKSAALRKQLCRPGEMLLLHIGRMSAEKSIDVLLDAAKLMKDSGLRFRLVIAGGGPAEASLKAKHASLGLGDSVHFAGFLRGDLLPQYYASADAFLTASPVETEGIVVLEAMASGLPIVCARAGALIDVVKEGYNGLFFEPGDAKGLVDKVRLLENKALLRRLSANALKVSGNYSIAEIAAKLENIYKSLTHHVSE
jgi:glycosyltransferase involved in cell wall biosynthesis